MERMRWKVCRLNNYSLAISTFTSTFKVFYEGLCILNGLTGFFIIFIQTDFSSNDFKYFVNRMQIDNRTENYDECLDSLKSLRIMLQLHTDTHTQTNNCSIQAYIIPSTTAAYILRPSCTTPIVATIIDFRTSANSAHTEIHHHHHQQPFSSGSAALLCACIVLNDMYIMYI